ELNKLLSIISSTLLSVLSSRFVFLIHSTFGSNSVSNGNLLLFSCKCRHKLQLQHTIGMVRQIIVTDVHEQFRLRQLMKRCPGTTFVKLKKHLPQVAGNKNTLTGKIN
uniref:Uncharacterized protein n=1 Tax=Oryza brachyantha TaxID=4533 RepID=J3LQK2_ORYBR